MSVDYTTLYMTVDDGETGFKVPTDWLKQRVKANYNMTVNEFMEEYTSDESTVVLYDAFIDGLIPEDEMNHVLGRDTPLFVVY